MSVVHVHVPGLVRRHVEHWLHRTSPVLRAPDRRSDLVLTFPPTIANVQWTMITGQSADRRGTLVHETVPPGDRDFGEGGTLLVRSFDVELPAHAVVHALVLDLFDAIRRSGVEQDDEWAALHRIGMGLATILEGGHDLLVTGGPSLQRARRRVELPTSLTEVARLEGALAIVPRVLIGGERDACLCAMGVERVLQGEALTSWGAPAAVGAILIAEPGWSFEAGEFTFGRREIADPDDTPVVLAWGGSGTPWPTAVHDHRIGPTLAEASGRQLEGADDEALPW